MAASSKLEFLLVSEDYTTFSAVSGGIKKSGGRCDFVPTTDAARAYLVRRNIDGIFVDLEVPGAQELIRAIRKGSSNSRAAVFAIMLTDKASTATLNAGANFLLRKPVQADGVALHIMTAKDLMLRERRRYFRHAVNLPVTVKHGEIQRHARMTDLSEGGMAIHTAETLTNSSLVEFAFDLNFGPMLSGRGQVAWTNAGGMAGIQFHNFHGEGRKQLEIWLTARERLSPEHIETPTPR
jgi:DNA-binding response OmpR family regulator